MDRYKKGKIYIIKNHKNALIYIGSTIRTIQQRAAEHFNLYPGANKLIKAIQELGVDNFYVELLENYPCNSLNELEAREYYWINKLNSVDKGYNINRGETSNSQTVDTPKVKLSKNHVDGTKIVSTDGTSYQCKRCHYTTRLKQDMVKHLLRIYPCPETFSNIPRDIMYNELLQKKTHQCKYCDNSYDYDYNLKRHIKTKHKDKIEDLHTKKQTEANTRCPRQIKQEETKDEEANKKLTDTKGIPYVFGSEDTSYINLNMLVECLEKISTCGIQNIVEKIWCDMNVMMNQNVLLKREHSPQQVYVYQSTDGEENWHIRCAEEVLWCMIDKVLEMLLNKKDELGAIIIQRHSGDNDVFRLWEMVYKIKNRKKGCCMYKNAVLIELRKLRDKRVA